jgi:hypothetical protein
LLGSSWCSRCVYPASLATRVSAAGRHRDDLAGPIPGSGSDSDPGEGSPISAERWIGPAARPAHGGALLPGRSRARATSLTTFSSSTLPASALGRSSPPTRGSSRAIVIGETRDLAAVSAILPRQPDLPSAGRTRSARGCGRRRCRSR